MAMRLMPGLERRLKREGVGEVLFGDFDRGRYATDASSYQLMPMGVVGPAERGRGPKGDRGGAGRRRLGAGARRRHVAGRADGERVAGGRLLQAPHAHSRARCCGQALRGRARHRARRLEPRAQAARAVVSGRRLHLVARDDRRHGGEQFLRRPLAALRHDARQRALDRRGAGRRRSRAFRQCRAGSLGPAGGFAAQAACAGSVRHRRARGGRDRDALPEGAAPGRRL